MNQKKHIIATFMLLFGWNMVSGQNNVGIGTNTPNPNAVLEMQSTTQGVLVPRLTTVQRNAIAAPTEGLLVYDTDANCFFFYESTAATWTNLCAGGGAGSVGPQGPAGPTGPQGAAGATGAQGPQGVPGTTGQMANTVYSTGALALTSSMTATYVLVPGLTQTITVPANAKVYVSTDGGIQNQNTGINHGVVDLAVFIDGTATELKRRVHAANTNSLAQIINQWSLTGSFNLSAGSHTIALRGKYAEGTANVNVGGTNDLIKGNLTVIIIKE